MDKLIDSLQGQKSYTVTEIGKEGKREFEITNYRAINSKHNEPQVVEEIATAETVTCAVGPNILKFIAPVIAKGIEARKESKPVAVIACENMVGGTDKLKELIFDKLSDETKQNIDSKARFANSAIDRIVPAQDADAGLNVKIEEFFEWCVEVKPFKDIGEPKIKGVHYVEDLKPYIERKLYTVNTGHATTAYFGYAAGKKYIHEALADKKIHDTVRDTLEETASIIVKQHGIAKDEQQEYVDKVINRFSNPELKDEVVRVARAPLRKIGRKERFVGPAAELAEAGMKCDNLVNGVEMALRFQNVEGDDESKELATKLKELDAKSAAQQLCGLEPSHPLFEKIVEKIEKVQKS